MNKSIISVGCASAIFISCIPQLVLAHGYISSPQSRSYFCKLGSNANCGPVQWEPQSVEGPDRFPETGPDDGKIASGGLSQFSQLNEQTATRWHKTSIQSGWNQINWHFTANHSTRDWRYYITKPTWNPNQPLTRNSFDLNPFCVADGNNRRPPVDITHNCYVPERDGYHVILGVWDVGDTTNSFYQVVDVQVGGGEPPTWIDIGDINPTMNLNVGDKVMTRVFDNNGELPSMQTTVTIDSTENGDKNTWPFLLAEKISQEQILLIAGIQDANNDISPVRGKNDVFTTSGSSLTRVEISIEQISNDPEFNISNLNDNYLISNGSAKIGFSLTTSESLKIDATVYNSQNHQAGFTSMQISGTQGMVVDIANALPGSYTLVLKATSADGWIQQQTLSFNLVSEILGEYDHVYPNNIETYVRGTRVLARDGGVYECKPFPYSGWCTIYSAGSTHYEPGYGSHWQDAWIMVFN